MIQKEKYIYLYTHCRTTKGESRSIIYDLEKEGYDFIPNSLHEIINRFNGYPIDEILMNFETDEKKIVLGYFEFLIEKGFCFLSKNKIPITNNIGKYEYAEEILNCIIDVNKDSNHDWNKISTEINEIGIPYIQLRFFDKVTSDYLIGVLKKFHNTQCRHIELIVPYTVSLDNKIENVLETNSRLQSVIYHSCKEEKVRRYGKGEIYYYKSIITDESHCGKNNPLFFTMNKRFHDLSIYANTCLFKKISIDKEGNIKNCPSLTFNFGNISTVSLSKALMKSEFKELWYINKEQVEICKTCEFRNICTDCRAYRESESLYSKPSKCNYNPITMEWGKGD